MLVNITVNIDVEPTFIYFFIILATVLILYSCLDVNYFVTLFCVLMWCRIKQKRIKFGENTEYYDICTTNDIDLYIRHMNNARFIRELDFVRLHFYQRSGLYDKIFKNGIPLQTATHIRYRRPIALFSVYKVTTKMVYWDEKHLYLEHRFITLKDGFVTTVVLSKQTFVGVNVAELIDSLAEQDESYKPKLPKPPPELDDFLRINEKSSERLRRENYIST